jgi:hypothetical protein
VVSAINNGSANTIAEHGNESTQAC